MILVIEDIMNSLIKDFINNLEYLYIGMFFLLVIYHFFIFLGRKKDLSNIACTVFNLAIISAIFFNSIFPIYSNNIVMNKIFDSIGLMLLGSALVFMGSTFFNLKRKMKLIIIDILIVNLICIIAIVFYCFSDSFYITLIEYNLGLLCFIGYSIILFSEIIRLKQYKTIIQKLLIVGFVIFHLSMANTAIFMILSKGIYISVVSNYTPFVIMAIIFAFTFALKFNNEYNELNLLKSTLEQKVTARTRELEEANEQKTEAFINISHEIKTPVTLIYNYLDKHLKNNKSTEELDIALQNAKKLKRDITNVLDFSKLEKNMAAYDHSKISDLSQIIEKTVYQFKEFAFRKGIDLICEADPNIYVKIDPDAVSRILNNLIDNAIKYSEPDGSISVSLTTDGNNTVMSVNDTGIGIPEEMLEHIFKPYFQVSRKKSNIQGIGMGLNIVKKLIDAVDGKISVVGRPEKGTSVKVIFNRYFLNKNDRLSTIDVEDLNYENPVDFVLKISGFDENKKNVLLVEDNRSMLAYIHNELVGIYNIYYAFNGKEALEKLGKPKKPDIIISDIMMDVMDGLEFRDELLKKEEFDSIPFIFLTARISDEEKVKSLEKGAVDYITKPFNIDELKAKLTALLKIKDALNKERLDELAGKIYEHLKERQDITGFNPEGDIFDSEKDNSALYKKYGISGRQVEIISLLEKGLERKEISGSLNISMSTVNTHIERLYKKFNVSNRIELLNVIKE